MSNYIGDLSQFYTSQALSGTMRPNHSTSRKNSGSLEMADFLSLMVAQFQNQTMDNTANTTDMLNQLVQMQMIEAITNITDATVMMYAGSLVGKEVTIGQYNNQGELKEIVGTVSGTGTSNGEQVIFVGDQAFKLNEIMAVGRLPEVQKPEAEGGAESVPSTEPGN